MGFDPISSLFSLGKAALERIWPNPKERDEHLRKLEEIRERGDQAELGAYVKVITAQLKINAIEAAHPSLFVSGWRPFIGWAGGASMVFSGLVHPFLCWLITLLKAFDLIPKEVEPPPLIESGVLVSIVTGMLGVGAMRSHDKSKGVDTKRVKLR